MYDEQSLSHTKWDCKYHIIWITKYHEAGIMKQMKQGRTGHVFTVLTAVKTSSQGIDGSRGGLAQSYAHRRKLGGRSLLTTGGNFLGNKGESVPQPLVHQADGVTIHPALSHSFF